MKKKIILYFIGIWAIISAVFGYSGLFRQWKESPNASAIEAGITIIENAQMWFLRPRNLSGGGGLFTGLDFNKIGMTDQPEKTRLKIDSTEFLLKNISTDCFDLEIRYENGYVQLVDSIFYNSRPDIPGIE